jgi:2-oxoglutarate ferredoxin oxidoreductase subunit alpha
VKPTEPPESYILYKTDKSMVPVLPDAGDGYRIHITGLTHDDRGYPSTDAKTQDAMIRRLIQKIQKNRDRIIEYKDYYLEKARIVIVAYGATVRPALKAMRALRESGLEVGLLKLNTIWPFAEDLIRSLSKQVEAFVVPEVNFGQITLEVERCAHGRATTTLIPHAGGSIHTPAQIEAGVKKAMRPVKRKGKR